MDSKVAKAARATQIDEIRRMAPAERVALALELGRRDLEVYVAVQRVDRERALEDLTRARETERRRAAARRRGPR